DLETLKGWKEVAGLHYRGDHDLKGHQEGSKEKLEVTVNGKKVLPHVLELSFGVDRNIWALLDLFFKEEKERTLFEFPAELAPLDLSVNPLVNKDGIDEEGREVYERLRKSFKVFYDDSGSIGRRYRRADEVGIKANVTIDHQTMEDHTITLRDRDSMKQIRIDLQFMEERIQRFLNGEELEELGEVIK
ncbi:MAG TPA: His/Gly/Thr/Pro-type tRNA ligase C-terminal domain-containing protein, partial [Candidatus Nanoarchaeia archaeon]|nr:His/Gly/Thr/Pro-type tRNA ligase C-terminal domain-containing protein [Candidatus Nanoarchaeia archaeon]